MFVAVFPSNRLDFQYILRIRRQRIHQCSVSGMDESD